MEGGTGRNGRWDRQELKRGKAGERRKEKKVERWKDGIKRDRILYRI